MNHRLEETLSRDICIGCGGCAVVGDGQISMQLTEFGIYRPDITLASSEAIRKASRVCPFSDESRNEDELGAPRGNDGLHRHPKLGLTADTFAGRVTDEGYLEGSSSGGLTSWLLRELLLREEVDFVVSVGRPKPASNELFTYGVRNADDALENRKSQYYATTLDEVMSIVRGHDARYAIVGVPCYIRALRNIAIEDPTLGQRLTFFISLVCGHMKTQNYAEALAWQLEVPPPELETVDFRVKEPTRPATDYSFGAKNRKAPKMTTRRSFELVGANWGHNLFQPEACNFCDDVVGETADISFGDAWLPQFSHDSRGTNIVLSRNGLLTRLIRAGAERGELELFGLTPDEAADSQAGGFRHRREGLAIRLADDKAAGLSVPRKRVEPSTEVVSSKRARLIRQRRLMAKRSHGLFLDAKAAGDLSLFLRPISKEIRRYRRLSIPLSRRLLSLVKRTMLGVPKRSRT